MSISSSPRTAMRTLAIAFALSLAAGCARPSVDNIAMEIQRIDFDGVDLAFDIDVSNPLPLALAIPAGAYSVDIAGKDFIESDDVPSAELPAGGSTRIALPVTLRYLDLFRLANNLRGESQVPYDLSGHVRVLLAGQEIELPFSHAGEFPVMSLPTIRVQDVDLRGTSLSIQAEVDNPNVFSIGLEELGYGIRIGDLDLSSVQARTSESIDAGQSGAVTFTAAISATQAAAQLLRGDSVGAVKIRPTGRLRTPYGAVKLP